jgi:hypothetical protein
MYNECVERQGVQFKGSNIKNVCLTCERIRLTFGLFSLLLHGFQNFLFHFHFMHLGRVETSHFLATTLWGSTKSTMLTLELIKKRRRVGVFSTMSSIRKRGFFHFHKIWTRVEKKKKNKEAKNLNNEQPWTLTYTSILQTMSSPLSSLFWVQTNWYPLQNDVM